MSIVQEELHTARLMSASVIPPGIGGIQKPGTVENYPRILVKPQSTKSLRPYPNTPAPMPIAEKELQKQHLPVLLQGANAAVHITALQIGRALFGQGMHQ